MTAGHRQQVAAASQATPRPEYVTIRGDSKLEGYHQHILQILPDTKYSRLLGQVLLLIRTLKWNV